MRRDLSVPADRFNAPTACRDVEERKRLLASSETMVALAFAASNVGQCTIGCSELGRDAVGLRALLEFRQLRLSFLELFVERG